MNANEKLIRFMEEKAELLSVGLSINRDKYFNSKDRNAILKWPDHRALDVWEKIQYLSKATSSIPGLTADFCPFCLYHRGYDVCDRCEYGDEHGECPTDDSSDYTDILMLAGQHLIKKMILTHAAYKEIVEKIEKEALSTKNNINDKGGANGIL